MIITEDFILTGKCIFIQYRENQKQEFTADINI